MMNCFKLNRVAIIGCMLLFAVNVSAQSSTDTIKYDHQDLFGPITWPVTSGNTRSANGNPGEHYWQNRADYSIKATLNEAQQDTTIAVKLPLPIPITALNQLDHLWLQLDQNLFKPGSRGADVTPYTGDRYQQRHAEPVDILLAVAPTILIPDAYRRGRTHVVVETSQSSHVIRMAVASWLLLPQ